MLSFEAYEVVHISCIIIFAGLIGFSFASSPPPRWVKISLGITTIMIFVAGMGLMARMGIGHGEGSWPGWIIAKMTLWLALAISTPILSKRLPPTQKAKVFWLLMAVFIGIVYIVIYQPF